MLGIMWHLSIVQESLITWSFICSSKLAFVLGDFSFFLQIFIDLHKLAYWKILKSRHFCGWGAENEVWEPGRCSSPVPSWSAIVLNPWQRDEMTLKGRLNQSKMKRKWSQNEVKWSKSKSLSVLLLCFKHFPTEERKCFDASTGRWSCAENRYANLHHGNREAYETHRGRARIKWI